MFKMLFFVDLLYCIIFAVMTKADSYDTMTNDEYNSACVKWRLGAWMPLIICSLILLCLVVAAANGVDWELAVGSFLCWWIDLLFTAIRSVCASGYLTRIKISEPPSEQTKKNFSKEANNKTYGTAAIVGGVYSVGKHAKKAIKEITE
ncbi:MAG: hypothetical protein J6Z11_08640 [Candidatus Riflebacteria bacterium]|nr:hypothetical protein [Candidatus Riflebacteria bacterium]